jgi:hypothetical protein
MLQLKCFMLFWDKGTVREGTTLGLRDRAVEDTSSDLSPRMHRGRTRFRAQGAVGGKWGS